MAIEKPINIGDMVKETADLVGVGGNYSLNGAAGGFFGFVAAGFATKKVIYRATDGIDIEIAEATVNSGSPDTITRPATDGDIIRSTNNDSRVNWAAGTTVEIINFVNASRVKTVIDDIELLNAKGKLLTHNGTAIVAPAVGANGTVPTADSTHANGWDWKSQSPGGLVALDHQNITTAVADVVFNNTVLTGYDEYLIRFVKAQADTAATGLGFQVSDDNGSTYVTTGCDHGKPDVTAQSN